MPNNPFSNLGARLAMEQQQKAIGEVVRMTKEFVGTATEQEMWSLITHQALLKLFTSEWVDAEEVDPNETSYELEKDT